MWGGVGYGPDKGFAVQGHGRGELSPWRSGNPSSHTLLSFHITINECLLPGIWAAHCECKFKISLPCQVTHQSYPSSDNNVDIFVQCEF